MNKAFLSALIILLFAGPVLAQDALGARPMGMGGAFVGLADDVNSIFSNPAGVAAVGRESLLVSTRLRPGREYSLIGGVEQTPFGSLGIGYVGTTDPDDLAAGATPTKSTTQTLYVTLAEDLNRKMRVPDNFGHLSLGVNLKFSSRKIGTETGLYRDGGSNVDVDLATVFKPRDDLSFGLSLQNFANGQTARSGGLNTLEGSVSAVTAGVSGRLFGSALIWSLENSGLGCEWRPVSGLALRAGRDNAGNQTSGFGLNLNGFCVDYAFANNGAEPVHYWSVAIKPVETRVAAKEGPKTVSVLPDGNDI
ncbi:MAG: hypothetical protein JW873_01230 [Candidatus Saganbacteria bacterium]|nr:hypothetical protein [Candidatus Saganbacteria bacterium]